MDFSSFKKNKAKIAETMTQKMKEFNEGKNYTPDARFYAFKKGKDGTSYVTMRFLPSNNEKVPHVVLRYSHSFQVGKRWFIEKCPTTIKKPCYCCEENGKVWDAGKGATIRKRSRKKEYIANVLIVKDALQPECEGKVFLFQFGEQIYQKIKDKIDPPKESGEAPMDIFDFDSGANFKLIVKPKVFSNEDGSTQNSVTYENSVFEAPMAIPEAKQEKVFNSEFDLGEFVAETSFKSYEELKKQYIKVVSNSAPSLEEAAKKEAADDEGAEEEESEEAEGGTIPDGTPSEEEGAEPKADIDSYFDKL